MDLRIRYGIELVKLDEWNTAEDSWFFDETYETLDEAVELAENIANDFEFCNWDEVLVHQIYVNEDGEFLDEDIEEMLSYKVVK